MAVNAALLVPSVIALVLALYPAPWHIRTRNIATCSMIFWMTCLNLVDTVNCEPGRTADCRGRQPY